MKKKDYLNKTINKIYIIQKLSDLENITTDNFLKNIKIFEKLIKNQIKNYEDNSGLEDYKLNEIDYNILYILYINTNNTEHKINLLLYFIYSYYKLDGIDYNKKKFPFKNFFNFLKENENIYKIIFDIFEKIYN